MLVSLLVATASAEEWRLCDAVAHALEHNLEVRQEALDRRGAEAALVQARAARGPTLTAAASASGYDDPASPDALDDGAGWSLGVTQPLPTGGTVWLGGSQDRVYARRLGPDATVYSFTGLTVEQPLLDGAWGAALLGVDRARFEARAAELALRDARERLAVDVANAYWELVAARESTRLAVRSVDIAEKQLADTKERFDEGFAGSGDVLQVERALGVARQTRVVAEASEAAAARTLARRMGLPVGTAPVLVMVDRPAAVGVEPEVGAALAEAHAENAAFALARLAVEAARRDRSAARVSALPDLDVSAPVGLSTDGAPGAALSAEPEAAWSLGASLTVPLAVGGALAEAGQGELTLRRAELDAEAAREDLDAQLYAALDALRRDRARVSLAEATLRAAEAGLAADQELYREGRGSTRDVVRSLEVLEEAQVAHLAAQIDLQAAWLTLARLRGRVLEELGVGG